MSQVKRTESGVTILEVLVALGLIGIVAASATTYLVKANFEVRRENEKSAMLFLADRIQLELGTPDAIRNAIDNDTSVPNQILKNCVAPGVACTKAAVPNVTEPAGQLGFYLYSSGENTRKIAGPPSDPIGYTKQGELCAPGNANCTFGVLSWFWGTCPINTVTKIPNATCTDPIYMNFRFQIRPLRQPRPEEGGRYTEFPNDAAFNASSYGFAVRLRTADIVERTLATCAPDQRVKSIGRNGLPVCECVVQQAIGGQVVDAAGTTVGGSKSTDAFGRPICGAQTCPNNDDIMVGYDATGNIKCLNYKTQCGAAGNPLCPCKDVDLAVNGDCGPGYWMVSINYGGCHANSDKGKGGPDKVICDNHQGRCCKLDM